MDFSSNYLHVSWLPSSLWLLVHFLCLNWYHDVPQRQILSTCIAFWVMGFLRAELQRVLECWHSPNVCHVVGALWMTSEWKHKYYWVTLWVIMLSHTSEWLVFPLKPVKTSPALSITNGWVTSYTASAHTEVSLGEMPAWFCWSTACDSVPLVVWPLTGDETNPEIWF